MRCAICDRRDDLPGGPRDSDICGECARVVGAGVHTVYLTSRERAGFRS